MRPKGGKVFCSPLGLQRSTDLYIYIKWGGKVKFVRFRQGRKSGQPRNKFILKALQSNRAGLCIKKKYRIQNTYFWKNTEMQYTESWGRKYRIQNTV